MVLVVLAEEEGSAAWCGRTRGTRWRTPWFGEEKEGGFLP